MSSLFGFLNRTRLIINPPTLPKTENAIRIGILGAANIAPMALIVPARLHPEVIIQAVAARDRKKADAFAKKHGIPQVFDTYQDLIDSPSIDAIYNPLPNGLHFEWTLKALAKGKHVLLEKPSVSNSTEAALLFHSPLLHPPPGQPPAPVLLEAFHYRFHPSWIAFVAELDQPNIAHAASTMKAPSLMFSADDIRFNYALGGGSLMDTTYTMSVLRGVFGTEPVACTACDVVACPPPNELCDYRYDGTWTFPNGGTGEMHGTLGAGLWEMLSDLGDVARVEVLHRPVVVEDAGLPAGQTKTRRRKVVLNNFIQGAMWHRIDVGDEFEVREGERTVKTWTMKEAKKVYTFRDTGIDMPSEAYWTTYKYQLDAFVDRIRGREGSGTWVDGADSVGQARMIDMAYEKSVLPLRPTSTYQPEPVV